jgi:photosystem II stability/assembly factor-like uncharacterized protein
MPINITSGINYHSDCSSLGAITNPLLNNSAGVTFGGFFIEENNSLKKTRANRGVIYAEDASKLIGSLEGYVGLRISLTKEIKNGVIQGLLPNQKYLLWGTNVGEENIALPTYNAMLTEEGIVFNIKTSTTDIIVIDNTSNISANTEFLLECSWTMKKVYDENGAFHVKLSIHNQKGKEGSESKFANNNVFSENISNTNFVILDNLSNRYNLECDIKEIIIASKLPQPYYASIDNGRNANFSPADIFNGKGLFPSSGYWNNGALSSNGKYQTVIGWSGYTALWCSSDYGATWIQKIVESNGLDVSMSLDGKYQIALFHGVKMFYSHDFGQSWTQATTSFPSSSRVASSCDGRYMIASNNTSTDKGIYYSVDYGVNWIKNSKYPSGQNCDDASISYSGKYQTVVTNNGYIHTSNDYGNTWIARNSIRSWYAVKISHNGKYQCATVNGNPREIYISSDYGINWTKTFSIAWNGLTNISDVAMSYNGRIILVPLNGSVYISNDFGATWTVLTISTGVNPWGVAISPNASYCIILPYSGSIIYGYNSNALLAPSI